jgi:ATP synthase protein I
LPFNPPIPNSKPPGKRPSGLASLVEAEKMVQIAILLPCSAFIGWLIGAWLDTRLHQSWITLAGILFGGFAGLVYVIRLVVTSGAHSKSDTNPSPPPADPSSSDHD